MRIAILLTGIFWISSAESTLPKIAFASGKNALAVGNYARAISYFRSAEAKWEDPIEIAFHLGLAYYHLALQKPDHQTEYLKVAADQLSCCLEPGDRHHALALFWLGNCTLKHFSSRQPRELQKAKDYFEHFLEQPNAPSALITLARENLEFIRLRMGQILPPPGLNDESPPNQNETKEDKEKPSTRKKTPGTPDPTETPGEAGTPTAGKEKSKETKESANQATNAPPSPGTGNRPPLEDPSELVPITVGEAREQLEKATQRILEEEKNHRNQKKRPRQQGVRDW